MQDRFTAWTIEMLAFVLLNLQIPYFTELHYMYNN